MRRIIFVVFILLLLCGCEKEKTNFDEDSPKVVKISDYSKDSEENTEVIFEIESRLSPYDIGDNITEIDEKIRVIRDQAMKEYEKMASLAPGAYDSKYNLLFSWNELVKAKYVTLEEYGDSFELSNIEKIDDAEIIIIDKSVWRIGDMAFEKHDELSYVYIPDSIKSIGSSAFSECTGLKSIIIREPYASLYASSFYSCDNLEYVYCPSPYLWESCFSGCENLKVVDLQAQHIGCSAFSDCKNLLRIDLSKAIEIEASAFSNCYSLYEIVIPNCTERIGEEAFSGCGNIRTINVDLNNTSYYSENNALVEKSTKKLIAGCMNSVIPDDVEIICRGAFQYCEKLKNVVFPNGLQKIGDWAFSGCSSIEEIYIPASVNEIGVGTFSYCENLCKIKVDENNPIYDSRNDCNAIIQTKRNIVKTGCYKTILPKNAEYINDYAFDGCTRLTYIYIPYFISIKGISESAFWGCRSLKKVEIVVDEDNKWGLSPKTFGSEVIIVEIIATEKDKEIDVKPVIDGQVDYYSVFVEKLKEVVKINENIYEDYPDFNLFGIRLLDMDRDGYKELLVCFVWGDTFLVYDVIDYDGQNVIYSRDYPTYWPEVDDYIYFSKLRNESYFFMKDKDFESDYVIPDETMIIKSPFFMIDTFDGKMRLLSCKDIEFTATDNSTQRQKKKIENIEIYTNNAYEIEKFGFDDELLSIKNSGNRIKALDPEEALKT